jgi:hypothetical protein
MKNIKTFGKFLKESTWNENGTYSIIEMDTDTGTNNRMRENSPKMVKIAKQYESLLNQAEVKIQTANSQSAEDSKRLREEAISKIENGENRAYGIMQWSDDICQSLQIISPRLGFDVLRIPKYSTGFSVSYRENDDFSSLEIYNTPNQSKSIYMEADGDVLFQMDDYEKSAKGTMANKITPLV